MSDIVLVPPGESIPIFPTSSAFAHGFGLFETICYCDGKLQLWKDHWARLSKSAKAFALLLPRESAVLEGLRQLVVESELDAAILKLSLVKEAEGSRLYVYTRPPFLEPNSRILQLDRSCPIFEHSALAGHKTHNYMEATHLLGLARAQGYYDILRVDSMGNLAETTTANVFFAEGSQLYTPSLNTGILPGVTRAALLRSTALDIEEGEFPPERLLEADGIFVTNASSGPVQIDGVSGFSPAQLAEYKCKKIDFDSILREFRQIQAERALKLI